MQKLKLVKIGNSVGAILSKETLAALHANVGDQFFLTDSPDGMRLTPYDPVFETQMNAARRIMKRRRDALRELAK